MGRFLRALRRVWLQMLEPPWRDPESGSMRSGHWFVWLVGWTWILAGVGGGAMVAPQLVQAIGLANTPYQDWLVIAVAVVTGFLVQVLGWGLAHLIARKLPENLEDISDLATAALLLIFALVVLVPLAAVGYGIYRYLTWVGADQREVTIALVGGLLIKTFVIPLIKGIVTGALFSWVVRALGGKGKKSA